MADQIRFTPVQVFDANGDPAAGAKAYFYQTGTTTPLTTYADEGLTTPHPNPLVADAQGVFAAVFISGGGDAKVDVTDAADVRLNGYPIDPATIHTGGAGAGTISFSATAENPNTNVQDAIDAVSHPWTTAATEDLARVAMGVAIGSDVQAYDADTMKSDTDTTLTAGYAIAIKDDGTISGGTYTPTYIGGDMMKIVNGGTFTIAAPSAAGEYTLIVAVTNNGSAGAVTFSGFDKQEGNALTLTNGHVFYLYITKLAGKVALDVKALQ